MRVLITYLSRTGNTRKIAESIYRSIPDDKELKPLHESGSTGAFDIVFIGFPVEQFGPPPEIRQFFKTLPEKTNTAVFVTHAMLNHPEDQSQAFLLKKELEKCQSIASKTIVRGFFHCQGELSEAMANDLEASIIPMLKAFAGMRSQTLGHPDQMEVEAAERFTIEVLSSLQRR